MGRSNQLVAVALLVAGGLLICRIAAAADVKSAIADEILAHSESASSVTLAAAEEAKEVVPGKCDSCSSDCGCAESRCGPKWIVETEAVWLSPMQNQRFGEIGFISGDSTTEFHTHNNSSFTLSPRIALGIQGECWGLIGRYWRLQTADLSANLPTITGGGVAIDNSFCAETADLEVTRLFAVGKNCSELRLSAGARYAQLNEAAGLTFERFDGIEYYRGSAFAEHNFSGCGMTAGLRGIRPIGCGRFHLFVDGRASILWDSDNLNYVATRAEYLGVGGDSYSIHDAISASANHLFIGEIQLGGQWNLPLECLPGRAFVRMALEYQYWGTGVSGGAEAASAAGQLGGPLVLAAASSSGTTGVNLFGFSVATGLTW
jgi:hypothetical protein